MNVTLVIINTTILTLLIAGAFLYRKQTYEKRLSKSVFRAGFEEKQVALHDGTVLNYGEGPRSGAPLLLIHGQGVDWKDYARVLPELARSFHVFAVDCHGHGKSTRNPEKYAADKIGEDFLWFIKNVIGESVIVSGHSSGGLLAAWLAANAPANIRGIVMEDPPFFSTEEGRREKTYAWVDGFRIIHQFHNQDDENDYLLYYLAHSYWRPKFGKLWDSVIKHAKKRRKNHPDGTLRIIYLPRFLNQIWAVPSNSSYDLRFGETFYDGSWFEHFDQAETLRGIQCPSILIHARNSRWSQYDDDGVLLAAMSEEDAARASELIPGCRLATIDCGHGVHNEKPREFTLLVKFATRWR